MNEWAARLMSVFPERAKADLDEFIQQVTHDQAEHMYFHKEYDAEVECRPTFEQLSHERIINEANKNINVLRALENIVTDRMTGYNSLHSTLQKTSASYELLENVDGTLKVALDSLFMFTDQELLQSKQHVFLGDLKKSLNEMRTDAQRRIGDYQKEVVNAEKEVVSAEKRLAKTKEALERSLDYRSKMESFELDVIVNTSRPVMGFGNSGGAGGASSRASKDSVSSASSASGLSAGEDPVMRIERELREDIRILLRTIEQRDNLLAASRRAFQKLHHECKKAAHITILKIAEKEQEQAEQRRMVLDKLCSSVKAVDIEHDERDFIESHSGRDGALVLTSQALSLLNDLAPPPLPETMDSSNHGSIKSGMYTYADPGRVDARTHSRAESPLVHRSSSSATAQANRSAPNSPVSSVASSKSAVGTPAGPGSAASNGNAGPSASPAPVRFSFRRTLGLTSDFGIQRNVAVGATQAPPAPPQPVAQATPARASPPAPPSVVVAAGRVGGADASDSTNRDSTASIASTSSKPEFSKAAFAVCLAQIFYPSNAPATGGNSGAMTNRSQSEPAMTRPQNPEDRSVESEPFAGPDPPVTPKILIDDNYFHDPEQENDTDSTRTRQESMPFAKNPVVEGHPQGDSPETVDRKANNRSARITKSDLHCGALDWLRGNPHSSMIAAVEWLSRAIKTQAGRDAFTTELNQFRSRKVEVGEGFEALGAVLWTALGHCQAENDVHNASVIMMLSQTFYQRIHREPQEALQATENSSESNGDGTTPVSGPTDPAAAAENSDEEESGARGAENRQYIKDLLVSHPIWKDGNYWEQTLWQCAIEQLQTIPYDRAWHDMSRDVRKQAVRHVHEVIFSQVMAVTHSMMEMGCSAEQSREFLYRMCVIHQLSEAMRHSLLKHVTAASVANARRLSRVGTAGGRRGSGGGAGGASKRSSSEPLLESRAGPQDGVGSGGAADHEVVSV